jgi:hypothetical protein
MCITDICKNKFEIIFFIFLKNHIFLHKKKNGIKVIRIPRGGISKIILKIKCYLYLINILYYVFRVLRLIK